MIEKLKFAQPEAEALFKKLESMYERYTELERLVADPEVIANSARYTVCIKEHGSLSKIISKYLELNEVLRRKEEARIVFSDNSGDKDLQLLATDELDSLTAKEEALYKEIKQLFVSGDGGPQKNVIMEIRAGTGGEEAALFAGDLFRMYVKYAERQGCKTEVLDSSPTELGGLKEIIFSVEGRGAYQKLRYESGTHRVQRVPLTETSGRIHTSAATVAVLPEVEEVEIEIDPNDLEIDTFRASGPGGQKVNKTSSAVRITHKPTGLVVKCLDEKSQHKNKAKAMRILRSRLYEFYESQKRSERDKTRRIQIGTGDRSEKIRTYNFPQNRVTDHRINFSLYELDNVMQGNIDKLIDALTAHYEEEYLKQCLETV
ncbi:MAG TPA: peptide chain release factor 1 [Candidatus Brocadiia bacterium]|nr:peptide chain release factor 1 [Planctomycetota bacterium]MDO8092188.1 peptide chain release factor 1 [Candidatus Brocadiales bacterium]